MNKPVPKDHSTVKLLVAVLLIITGIGWTFYRVNKARPGAVANNGVTEEFVPPSPEEIEKTRRQMYAYANITPEQQRQLEELQKKAREMWEQRRAENTTAPQGMRGGPGGGPPGMGPGGFGGGFMGFPMSPELRGELDKILTKEQQEKAREFMRQQFQQRRAQREAKIKAALGDEEYQRYQEKLRERRGNRGGFRGGPRNQQGGQQGAPSNTNQNQGGRP